jgi:hypothetical protein
MKEKVEIERFEARDKDGQIFRIIGYQYFITHAPVYGQPVVLKGDVEYWTDSGLPVRKIDSTTYRVATTKETITRFLAKFSLFASRPEAIDVHPVTRRE